MKKAKDHQEALNIQEHKNDIPIGWIQWKGTTVCMDIHCKCGYLSHIDSGFAYHVKCPRCNTIYFCNGHIELIELEEDPENCVVVGKITD
jgi:phage FluMu protein Com